MCSFTSIFFRKGRKMFTASNINDVLTSFGVDLNLWGKEKAKTVRDLTQEIMDGECYLQIDDEGLARMVNIVKMYISDLNRPGWHLVEQSQILPDDQIRIRNQDPSGKIRQGESPEMALLREMKEGLSLNEGEFTFSALSPKKEQRPSDSYPGLKCVYVVYGFQVILKPGVHALRDSFLIYIPKEKITHRFEWMPN